MKKFIIYNFEFIILFFAFFTNSAYAQVPVVSPGTSVMNWQDVVADVSLAGQLKVDVSGKGGVGSGTAGRDAIDGLVSADSGNDRMTIICERIGTNPCLGVQIWNKNSSTWGDIAATKFTDIDNQSYYLDPSSVVTSGILAGPVVIGNTSPNSSAILDLSSTTQGFLPPRLSITQRNQISSPPAGLTIYDSTRTSLSFWDGTTWQISKDRTQTTGNSQVYTTPGTYTWTVPNGITTATFEVWGGGGGGAYLSEEEAVTNTCSFAQAIWGYRPGGGGGGGGYGKSTFSVTPGATYTVTVGSGGASNSGGPCNNIYVWQASCGYETATVIKGSDGISSNLKDSTGTVIISATGGRGGIPQDPLNGGCNNLIPAGIPAQGGAGGTATAQITQNGLGGTDWAQATYGCSVGQNAVGVQNAYGGYGGNGGNGGFGGMSVPLPPAGGYCTGTGPTAAAPGGGGFGTSEIFDSSGYYTYGWTGTDGAPGRVIISWNQNP